MRSAFERESDQACWPRHLAQLATMGVTPDMKRGKAWRRSSRGWYVPAQTPMTTTQRVVEAAPLIPAGGALAGWAAAYVLGVDLLDGQSPFAMAPLPVPIHLG